MATSFPDEIWLHIMELGVDHNILNYRDLSSVAISSRRLSRLSNFNRLWKSLWAKDFPFESIPETLPKNFKSLYKQKFERVRLAKTAAHKRLILRVQSQALVLKREIKDVEAQLEGEKRRLRSTLLELKNLEKARQLSVALKIWQPEIIRTRQQNVVEQTPVQTDYHIRSLKMEINVCRERIGRFSKSIHQKQNMTERVKRELEALTYKPLQDSCDKPFFQVKQKKAKTMEKQTKNVSNLTFTPYESD